MATKKMVRILVWLWALALVLEMVAAEPVSPTNFTVGASSYRDLSGIPMSTAEALAGNVTRLTIEAIAVTKSWQGYYGNVSGTIILSDANNNSLYEWGNGSVTTGEVFSSRNSTITWATINCSNATHIATEEAALGQVAADADSVTNTFTESDHPWFYVGLRNVSSCPSLNTFVSGSAQNTDFEEIFLADGDGKTVYTAILDHESLGFNGETHDFQMLVGEDGHSNTATTTYYFWVELGA